MQTLFKNAFPKEVECSIEKALTVLGGKWRNLASS